MNSKIAKRYLEDGMAVTPKPQLVVRLYERLLRDLNDAAEAMAENKIEGAHLALVHAQDIVHELNMALDLDAWDGAANLRSIYTHLTSQLIQANVDKNVATLMHCISLVEPLSEAWQEAALAVQADRSTMASATTTGSTGFAS